MSREKDDFVENSKSYMGKIKGNFSGSLFNIFGPGLSPSEAKEKNKKMRQMLATVEYMENQNGLFGGKSPKHFRVFILK